MVVLLYMYMQGCIFPDAKIKNLNNKLYDTHFKYELLL